jgi:type II secretory pathway pseudopilin PulG
MAQIGSASRKQVGFTYVALLILVAVLSLFSTAALRLGMSMQRHQAEQELLERGYAMLQGLNSFAKSTPAGQYRYPTSLEDLLRDPRYPKTVIRHVRRIEVDPITGTTQWGLVLREDKKGIVGLYSLSEDKPWRTSFTAPFGDFDDKPRYKDWLFTAEILEQAE